jgi:hypothetical protein
MNLNKNIIKVFARRTKFCPDNELCFFGEAPLYAMRYIELPVYVSITFSWDIERGKALAKSWAALGFNVTIGGPAMGDPGSDFVAGQFLREGITITSRGCPKKCPWCLAAKREGKLREINIAHGYIIQDNNLLACSRKHIEAVFEMLQEQKKPIKFLGGLDIDFMQTWHIDLLKTINIGKCGLCVACDKPQDLKRLDKAVDLLSDFDIEKKRCYVLVGFDGETKGQAQERCEAVLAKGFLPYAQLYRSENANSTRGDWRTFCYFWSKPGLYRKTIENGKS